jgi:molybdate transport system substrate-binding protein
MRKLQYAALLSLGLFVALAARGAEIMVFAAASLSDSLQQIGADYHRQTGNNVLFNLAASSTLARQIEAGAPADIFFSADEAQMQNLEKQGLILSETRRDRLGNSLVIVVTSDSSLKIHSPAELAEEKIRRIALADPQAVPAGVYSKEYLQKLNLWEKVAPKVVPMENVRGALAAVESGNVDAGMVYKTDADISQKVKVVYEIPREDGPKITYPTAVVKDSKQKKAAVAFLDYLEGEDAAKVFEHYGFVVLK